MENWWYLMILKNSLLFENWFLIHKRLLRERGWRRMAEPGPGWEEETKWIIYSWKFFPHRTLNSSQFIVYPDDSWEMPRRKIGRAIDRASDTVERWLGWLAEDSKFRVCRRLKYNFEQHSSNQLTNTRLTGNPPASLMWNTAHELHQPADPISMVCVDSV